MNVGNPILAVTASVPPRIAEAIEERNKLIARVLELNQEIALLETLRQVAPGRPVELGEDLPTPKQQQRGPKQDRSGPGGTGLPSLGDQG